MVGEAGNECQAAIGLGSSCQEPCLVHFRFVGYVIQQIMEGKGGNAHPIGHHEGSQAGIFCLNIGGVVVQKADRVVGVSEFLVMLALHRCDHDGVSISAQELCQILELGVEKDSQKDEPHTLL